MPKVVSMEMSIPGVEVWVNYLESNKRITSVEWTLPVSGVVARVRIWDDGQLVYDRSVGGPASGTENVSGQYRAVWDDTFSCYVLPPELTYSINIETIGA